MSNIMLKWKSAEPLLSRLKKITFVTKSAFEGTHAKLPIDHSEQEAIKKLKLRHKEIGNKFCHVFTERAKGIEVSHLALNEFMDKYPHCTVEDGHMVCGIGGDGTFLLMAQKLCSSSVPLLPINPDPNTSIGKLAGFVFNQIYDAREVANRVFDGLEQQKYKITSRSRLEVNNLSNPYASYPLGIIY